ncbi:ATPase, AAA-type, core, P-loop containing nucleoside triphosphate hydrolase [Tanacetum coccineum]
METQTALIDIQNAPEHYMAKLNQVLDPLLTSKDAPEQVKLIGMDTTISQMRKYGLIDVHMNVIPLDDVIYMGRRLDAFTKSVKFGGAGKKPIIVSRLIKIIIEYWMVNLKWDLKQISIEKWIVQLIGGVGKSATRSLKNTTNGREKGLKEKGNVLDVLKNLPQRNMQVIVVTDGEPTLLTLIENMENNALTTLNINKLHVDVNDDGKHKRLVSHQAHRDSIGNFPTTVQILKRLQGSAEYDRMNVKEPSRILIHGPNRTGKSSLVHAFAIEAKLPFFVVQGKEIEKNPPMIVSLFSEARVSSPSIIYIEGIEVITSTGVSQILYEMESCENDGAAFVVIGTAWQVIAKFLANSKQETIVRKGRQARVGKQELASKSRQGRSKKQEARSKKQEARSKKQEARSKKHEGERKQVEKGDKQQERKERSRKQEKFSRNFEQVDPVIGGVIGGGRTVKDGVSDQARSGDHKKASSKDCAFACTWLSKQEEKQITKRPIK